MMYVLSWYIQHLKKSHGFVKWCEEADRDLMRVIEVVNTLMEIVNRLTDRVSVQGKILEAINSRTVGLEHDIILYRQVSPMCLSDLNPACNNFRTIVTKTTTLFSSTN